MYPALLLVNWIGHVNEFINSAQVGWYKRMKRGRVCWGSLGGRGGLQLPSRIDLCDSRLRILLNEIGTRTSPRFEFCFQMNTLIAKSYAMKG